MLKTMVKLEQEHFGNKPGLLLQMPVDQAQELIDKGIASAYDGAPPIDEVEANMIRATERGKVENEFTEKRKTEIAEERTRESEKVLQPSEESRTVTAAIVGDGKETHVSGVHERVQDDPNFGFKSFGHMACAVAQIEVNNVPVQGWPEPLRMLSKASRDSLENAVTKVAGSDELSTQLDVYGGFLIPPGFSNTILRTSHEASPVLSRLRSIPMDTDTLVMPALVETSQQVGSLFGGVSVGTRPELGAMSVTNRPKFGQVKLALNEVYAYLPVTDRLIEKSPLAINSFLMEIVPEAIMHWLDDKVMNGTGAGQPQGILQGPSLVSQAAETGQAATTIVTENVLNMFSRLLPSSVGNSVWLHNPDTIPQLYTLTVNVGTGGNSVMMINMAQAGPPTMLGRPLIPYAHCATRGTVGDLVLADLNQYLLGQESTQQGVQVTTSIHVRFDRGETMFRFRLLMDGQPWMTSAITPAQGSNTLSAFIAIATRS